MVIMMMNEMMNKMRVKKMIARKMNKMMNKMMIIIKMDSKNITVFFLFKREFQDDNDER